MKFKIISISLFVAALFFNNLEANSSEKKLKKAIESAPYDVIIVPGVPYNDEDWSRVLKARIYWSYYLYEAGITKHIIYSGSAVYTPYVESEIMAMYAKELGIPEEAVFTETDAEHSVENVYNSYHIARELGFEKIALATDPFQSRMMQLPSRSLDLDVDFIPFVMEILETLEPRLDMVDININEEKAFVEDFISLVERKSFIQRFRGTLGKNIKDSN